MTPPIDILEVASRMAYEARERWRWFQASQWSESTKIESDNAALAVSIAEGCVTDAMRVAIALEMDRLDTQE